MRCGGMREGGNLHKEQDQTQIQQVLLDSGCEA